MAEEVKKIRVLSPEPELAKFLRRLEEEIRIKVLPPEYRDYVISWIEDVGSIMRSRSYLAGTVALYISYGLVTLPFAVMPELKRFNFVARVLGVRE